MKTIKYIVLIVACLLFTGCYVARQPNTEVVLVMFSENQNGFDGYYRPKHIRGSIPIGYVRVPFRKVHSLESETVRERNRTRVLRRRYQRIK